MSERRVRTPCVFTDGNRTRSILTPSQNALPVSYDSEVTLAVSITHALDVPAFVKTLASKKARTCFDPVAGQTHLLQMKNQERFAAAPPTAAKRQLSES